MNKFQKLMDAAFKKMEAIRKKAEDEKRSMTEEELTERANLKVEIETIQKEWDDFKAEEEIRANLYGDGDKGALTIEDPNAKIEMPDQPIYRGSAASALGQQLLDIRTMSRPDMHDSKVVSGARSRLEQTEKRNQVMLETQAKKENRAAATGGMTVGVPSDGGFFLQAQG